MATKLAVFVVNVGCVADKHFQEKSAIGADTHPKRYAVPHAKYSY
jgi:hypothetical protein